MSRLLKCDLHSHPLCHKYYTKNDYNIKELDDYDKHSIELYVNWCIGVRGLDVIAITDHDLIKSSLYAREYVKKNNLPIGIVTGAECEVTDKFVTIYGDSTIHLLCLGIDELPFYNYKTSADELIVDVHALGGIVIMSHPQFYPRAFSRLVKELDGYETLNRDLVDFVWGDEYLKVNGIELKAYKNSDYHQMEDNFVCQDVPVNYNELTEEFVKEFLIRDWVCTG